MNRFDRQVLEILPRLRRYALALSRDSADADDLVQDCVAKAFAGRGTWRGDNLQGWLMTILTNLNRNRLRSRARTPVTIALDDAGEPETGIAGGSLGENDPLERDRLVAALNQIHPDQRAVLMLVIVEGYRYGEVAAMLGIPTGTVMSRLSRARRTLAAILEGDNVVEFGRTR